MRPPAPPARARARRRRRRPIISDIQKIFPIFLPLLLWAWASNVYRVLRYGVTRERASGLVQMVLISARPSSLFPARTRNLRAPRAVVLIKFAIEELAPAKAALSDGLTREEAVVLKEKTGTMYCFQIPMTLLNLYNQSLKAEAYDKAVEDARAKELEDAPKKED